VGWLRTNPVKQISDIFSNSLFESQIMDKQLDAVV